MIQITPISLRPSTIAQVTEIFYNDISTVLSTAAKRDPDLYRADRDAADHGKRSLSKFNIFDFVITIALGSVFASTLTSSDVKLAQSITAIVILLGGQYIISQLALHAEGFENIIKSDPALLYSGGSLNRVTMKRERVTEREVLQAVRKSGSASLDDVEAVILETDGTMSVIAASGGSPKAIYKPVTR